MIKFDEDIHCRGCAGQGENPRTEVPCPECDGTGYKEIQVGYGPKSREHVILPGVLAAPPGKPYMAPVQTACGKRLSGLMSATWRLPGHALETLECKGCCRHLRKILSK